MPATLLEKLSAPRYKGKGGFETLASIFDTPRLYDEKMAEVERKFNVTHITAVRWYKEYRAMRGAK